MDAANHNISSQTFSMKLTGSTLLLIVWVLLTGLSIAAIVLTLVQPSRWPNFSDPHMGFETRSTKLSSRSDVITNLADASRPHGFITSNPEGKRLQLLQGRMHRQKLETWQRKLFKETFDDEAVSELPKVHTHSIMVSSNSTVLGPVPSFEPNFINETADIFKEVTSNGSGIQSDASYIKESELGHIAMEDYDESEQHFLNNSFANSDMFCGLPTWSHARIIISSTAEGKNIWNLGAIKEMCSLEKDLEPLYSDICETQKSGKCCRPWSLTNYLLLSSNKSVCEEIEEKDLATAITLLEECNHHFHNLELECIEEEGNCQFAPSKCTRKSVVRGLMNFVFDIEFLPPNASETAPQGLKYIQVILPIAKSTKSYSFYTSMQTMSYSSNEIKVIAMDLGLDDYVFDKLLINDSIWISLLIVFCLLIILLIVIRSALMVVFGLLNIIFSLAISYWLYCEILGADHFPFLNLMAALLLLAVGTDDLLFIASSWKDHHDLKMSDKILSQAPLWFSVTATSATTAAAMFAARLSSVTSIALFSIFAGTTMVIHWAMTLFWMVPSIMFSEALTKMLNIQYTLRYPKEFGRGIKKWAVKLRSGVLFLVTRTSFLCISIVFCMTVGATYALLVQPRLRAPDSKSFALFQANHPFERYHSDFTDSFWFERHQKSGREILPLTWVWGVKPIDSRDLLDPHPRPNGSQLIFEENFDITKPKAQVFLLRFCRQLKRQPFYKSVFGPLLQNCFLESLISYMSRKCYDSMDQLDRKPCCETSKFPYSARTFVLCLERAMKDLHNTPAQFFMPSIAGPKFDMRRQNSSAPRAIVIQYDSSREFSLSYEDMESFYLEVESWTERILRSAPNSMRGCFFTSDLHFYDLQNRLMTESVSSVMIGAGACSVVLYLTTCNLLVTLLAATSVFSILVSSLATLALLGWRLNILESLAVTMAAGLSVDFVLHYAIKYNGHLEREQRIKQLINKNLASVCVASITTLVTGLLLVRSEVLAFRQIGIFIVDLTLNSFFISTFGFLPLLYTFGPNYKTDVEFCQRLLSISDIQDEVNITSQAPLSDSNSVVINGLAPINPELHELENMSPTFLEDPTQNGHIFDTALLSATAKNNETKRASSSIREGCATLEPLLQDRV